MTARERVAEERRAARAVAHERPAERDLPELALSLQRSAGNGAVARLARAVRIDDGKTRVDEDFYTKRKGRNLGTKRTVGSLINDALKRVFADEKELRDYADGKLDYLGDVATKSSGTFWFRLPPATMTVLGEEHHSAEGNVQDVIRGFGTSRFLYEPFHELAPVKALDVPMTGTQARLDEMNKQVGVAGHVKLLDPALENIIVKALTGAAITRNQFFAADANGRADDQWKSRPTKTDYRLGERAALYLSMAIHIAGDVAKHDFGAVDPLETAFIKSARALKEAYLAGKAELDALMEAKDKDELTAIYELTAPGGFKNEATVTAFSLAFHEYGSQYVAQLGTEGGNAELKKQGEALAKKPGAKIKDFSPVREEIMWEKIQKAKGYLLVGIGDQHRLNMKGKLDGAAIPHAKVSEALVDHQKEVDTKWVK